MTENCPRKTTTLNGHPDGLALRTAGEPRRLLLPSAARPPRVTSRLERASSQANQFTGVTAQDVVGDPFRSGRASDRSGPDGSLSNARILRESRNSGTGNVVAFALYDSLDLPERPSHLRSSGGSWKGATSANHDLVR